MRWAIKLASSMLSGPPTTKLDAKNAYSWLPNELGEVVVDTPIRTKHRAGTVLEFTF